MTAPARPLATVAKVAIILQVLLAIGALAGGAMLFCYPDGSALRMPVSILEPTGFETFRIPGLLLFSVNGLFPLVSAIATLGQRPWAARSVMAVGVLLTGWIGVQAALLRLFDAPLHGTYLLLGFVIAALGLALRRRERASRVEGPGPAGVGTSPASLLSRVTLGATAEERGRPLAGDALISGATTTVMHAVTIAAPAARVWPWLAQMGSGRAGWYSYDWIDNCGRPSATAVLPEFQRVAPGDVLPSLPGEKSAFTVAVVEAGRNLILTVPAAGGGLLQLRGIRRRAEGAGRGARRAKPSDDHAVG